MKTTLKTLACLTTIGASTIIPQVARADSYSNFANNLGAVNNGTTEFGNQVSFTGGEASYTITNFTAQIYGTYNAGDTVNISFYGVTGGSQNGYAYTPGPLLYSTGFIDLSVENGGAFTTPGARFELTEGTGNGLPTGGVQNVTPTFVFTIAFGGPDAAGNGLALFGPAPTDGVNSSVAWEFDGPGGSGWTLVTNPPGTAPYNIGAEVDATPEPSSMALFGLGAVGLVAFGIRRRLAVR